MKYQLFVAIMALAAPVWGQEATPAAAPAPAPSSSFTYIQIPPSYSDLNCAGFLSKEAISKKNEIAGGLDSPMQTQYARGTIFVSGGGLQEGTQYSVVRELHDPNRYEPFVGQRRAIEETGQPYAELGRIRVTALRGNTAIAEVEFACQNMTVGDLVVPYIEHAAPTLRKTSTFERFPANAGKLTARIIMAREFDTELRPGHKVYLNVGSNKGVKVGDYFRAVRSYDPERLSAVDNLSYGAPVGEDTQKVPGVVTKESAKTLPPRATGEMVVLSVNQTSATAMITYAVEDIQVGDDVELEADTQQ